MQVKPDGVRDLTPYVSWMSRRDQATLALLGFFCFVALTIELDPRGTIHPVVYIRNRGAVAEHPLVPQPLHDYTGDEYGRELADRLGALLPAVRSFSRTA